MALCANANAASESISVPASAASVATSGADATRTTTNDTTPAPASSPSPQPSDSCTEMGAAARAVAAWRDEGGAAWMAKAKLDQQIDEPTVRQAAQQLVDTLYTGTMRKLGPDETALVVTQSCMDATRQDSDKAAAPQP
ncbi:hypothetical protein [Robbsia sp. KACC 23696]|uniref:hypothetical protein n=1 Tax=Robbsia sp. KACC 23696 TaxID=3149231 RepID=UPI00325BB853